MPFERPDRIASARRWPRLAAAAGLGVLVVAIAVIFGDASSMTFPTRTWTFQEAADDPGALGFQLSSKEGGLWRLADHEGASGNRALVNLAGLPGATAARAIVSDSLTRDLKVSTRCKASADRNDQACGLVFRYFDHSNYYVARVDARRGAVTLGVVLGGVERELRAVVAEVPPATWQELSVVAQADHLLVWLNGREVLGVHDPMLTRAGRVGVWAPSGAEAYFDEFSFAPLPATRAHPSDLLPILLRRKT